MDWARFDGTAGRDGLDDAARWRLDGERGEKGSEHGWMDVLSAMVGMVAWLQIEEMQS